MGKSIHARRHERETKARLRRKQTIDDLVKMNQLLTLTINKLEMGISRDTERVNRLEETLRQSPIRWERAAARRMIAGLDGYELDHWEW